MGINPKGSNASSIQKVDGLYSSNSYVQRKQSKQGESMISKLFYQIIAGIGP